MTMLQATKLKPGEMVESRSGGIWQVTNADYHADHQWHGHTMLEVARRSVVEFAALYVSGTTPRKPATPAMRLGSALHALVLEPDEWDSLVAVEGEFDRRTKLGRAAYESFADASSGKTIITPDQYESVKRMAESIARHPAFVAFTSHTDCVREVAIRANDLETGLPLKCKPDLRVPGWIIDIKTTSDASPDGWCRQAASLGYARQAAHYLDVVHSGLGHSCRFAHVVVQSSPPWECAAYYLEDTDIEHARQQNARTKRKLKACYESNVWVEPQGVEILRIKLPRWTEFVE